MNAESEVFEYSGLGGENVNRLIVIFWKKIKVHIETLHQHMIRTPDWLLGSFLHSSTKDLLTLVESIHWGIIRCFFSIPFAIAISGSYCCGRL